MKKITRLQVFRSKNFAGTIDRTDRGCTFTFDEDFLKNPEFKELTYQITKEKKTYTHEGVNLPPFFAGLLPEGLRLKALVKQLKTSEDDLFSLLAATGEHCVGDVYIKSDEKKPTPPQVPSVEEIDFYRYFEETLKSTSPHPANEGLAGVQEKLSASMISFPINVAKKKKSYILKLNSKDKPTLVQNELKTLQLAKKCGLHVNTAKLVHDKSRNPGLLVQRFDRIEKQNGEIQMIHQEDACQFLDRYPADKYRLSLKEVCEGIQRLATAPLIEILRILEIYIFSYLIGNGDLHAKNISLQTHPDNGRIQITPAYDLICTTLYGDDTMALKLDGRDNNFKRRYFLDFAKRYGLKPKAVEQMIDRLLKKLTIHQDPFFEIPNLTPKSKNSLKVLIKSRIKDLV